VLGHVATTFRLGKPSRPAAYGLTSRDLVRRAGGPSACRLRAV